MSVWYCPFCGQESIKLEAIRDFTEDEYLACELSEYYCKSCGGTFFV